MKTTLEAKEITKEIAAEASSETKSNIDFLVDQIQGNIQYCLKKDDKEDKKLGMGGIGVTGRKYESIDIDAPKLKEMLENETGKIVFLGNGISDYPLFSVQRYREGSLKAKPVIVDLFDYKLVEHDLLNLIEKLKKAHIQPPEKLLDNLKTVSEINKAVQSNDLIAIPYRLGKKPIPEELLEADLVVNVYGPAISILEEQLALLKSNGSLYITQVDSPLLYRKPIPEGFARRSTEGLESFIFTRLSLNSTE